MKSKINELFLSPETVYIFDVDGTLTPLEFGMYNHYSLNDEEWAKSLFIEDGYKNCRPIKYFQNFLSQRDLNRVFVVTKVMNEIELEQKKAFLESHYGIFPNHVFLVYKNEDKLEKMKEIQSLYPKIDSKYFVMIDDSVEVLNHIMENSSYSTVHISSFF